MTTWLCPNCEANSQLCFICGKLGKSAGPKKEVVFIFCSHSQVFCPLGQFVSVYYWALLLLVPFGIHLPAVFLPWRRVDTSLPICLLSLFRAYFGLESALIFSNASRFLTAMLHTVGNSTILCVQHGRSQKMLVIRESTPTKQGRVSKHSFVLCTNVRAVNNLKMERIGICNLLSADGVQQAGM